VSEDTADTLAKSLDSIKAAIAQLEQRLDSIDGNAALPTKTARNAAGDAIGKFDRWSVAPPSEKIDVFSFGKDAHGKAVEKPAGGAVAALARALARLAQEAVQLLPGGREKTALLHRLVKLQREAESLA
jgi:hypothetical protein